MTKLLLAGEALGFEPPPKRTVRVGETYGHLEVLEDAALKPGSSERHWRYWCLNIVEGRPCGDGTIKRTVNSRRRSSRAVKRLEARCFLMISMDAKLRL